MTNKASKRALYVDTESTFATEPSADGSEYVAIPTLTIGEINDGRTALETAYQTGRGYNTAPIAGPDGGDFSFSVPLVGLSDAARDGESPPAVDWLDDILAHIFGTVATLAGSSVDAVDLPDDFTLADDFAVHSLLPLYDALSPPACPRTQWALVTSAPGSGVHVAAPMPSALDSQGESLGTRNFRFSDDGGATLAFTYIEDDLQYTLLGCRATSAKITAEAGQMARFEVSVAFDRRSVTTKASLPAAATAPATTPVVLTASPVFFAGSEITTKKIEIDFGLAASPVMASAGCNGRSDHVYGARPRPTLMIEPLRLQAYLDLKHNVTAGQLVVQLGRGYHGAGSMPGAGVAVNSLAVAWGGAYAQEVSVTDDGGHLRQGIKMDLADAGGTAIAFQLSRC